MKFLKILLPCIFGVLFLTACQDEEPMVIKFPQIPDPTIEVKDVTRSGFVIAVLDNEDNKDWYVRSNISLEEKQGSPLLIDRTTNSKVDYIECVHFYGDAIEFQTEYGTYLQVGHTYEISVVLHIVSSMSLRDDLAKEIKHKYNIADISKPVTRTYSKKLTFIVPNE